MNRAVALVAQLEVRHCIPGLWDVILNGGHIVGTRLRYDHNVIQTNVGEVTAILIGEDRGRDAVAGMELRRDNRIFELVRHGHRVHEAGNGLALESNVRRVGAHDLSTYLKGSLSRRRTAGCWSRRAATAREQCNEEENK